uniref:ZM domain-containing protein n=2 Tax=Bursaphelenchus xylophilus TaxID=6326 RepID=A0A1I7SLM1_BURXY
MAHGNTAKDVFIPKLQMEYLGEQETVFKLSDKSVKSYVDESLKVLVAQSRRSDFSKPIESSYSSQSDSSPLFKRSSFKHDGDGRSPTPRSDIFRPPKSPREKPSAITQSPRYQIKYQISDLNQRRNGVDRNHQPFELRSVYEEQDDYLDSPRLFPATGRQSVPGFSKPQLVSVGEIYNDTSSGYSTASGASSTVPSTNTYWTRKDNNDFEFVPIREPQTSRIPVVSGPEWRKNSNNETYDPPSINELVNTLENFDPEPLLQRAVKAQQRVEELSNSIKPQRRPNTVLGEPYYNGDTRTFPSFGRKKSNGNVDFNDFPSNRRDSKRFPGLSTATISTDTSKPTDCSISASTNNLLNIDTRPTHRNIDVSQLDTVLQSPSSGSQPPNRLHSTASFDPDNFYQSREEWRDPFFNMRDRFGNDRDNGTINSRFGRAPSLLSKSASQGNLDYQNSDSDGNSNSNGNGYSDWSRPRNSLANFWLDTLRNHVDTPPAFQRAFSPRLSASERLEQLHEPLDDLDNHTIYRRPNAIDNVASRRAQYLKEVFGSHSPSLSSKLNESLPNRDPNFSELDDAVGDMESRSGCGRFPTNEVKYTTTTTNPDGSTTRSYFGQTRYTTPGGERRTVVTTRTTSNQHSPSPDTLSDTSQQSLLFLPHPRPKHNIREQLMNAGVNNFFSGFPTRRLLNSAAFSSPNFPAPTTGGVASRVSALEKRSSGTPNLLQLACVLNGSNPECGAPMSPRSTVFRRKPVIHVDYGDEDDIFKFPEPDQDSRNMFWDEDAPRNILEAYKGVLFRMGAAAVSGHLFLVPKSPLIYKLVMRGLSAFCSLLSRTPSL